MKSIIVYSGKGGVGKTTTAANLAKVLAEKDKKVFIVDGDINTPSMRVIFKTEHPTENIWVSSTSFNFKNLIYLEKSSVRTFFRDTVKKINQIEPDYVIIDTPPSITDVHINLLTTFKASAIAIVTQPSEISRLDVNRTARFFTEKYPNAACVVVENMVHEDGDYKYNWDVAARIRFDQSFNGEKVLEENRSKYLDIISALDNLKIEDVRLEAVRREIFNESLTEEDLPNLKNDHELKFINLSTWDTVRDRILESETSMHGHDKLLDVSTSSILKRFLEAFEYDTEAQFLITNAPNTEVPLITGEIGLGSMFVANSYYGIPRLKYKTKNGEVVLFPHEVTPVTPELMRQSLDDGYVILSDGRYLPPKHLCQDIYQTFGPRVGMFENWESNYDQIISAK